MLRVRAVSLHLLLHISSIPTLEIKVRANIRNVTGEQRLGRIPSVKSLTVIRRETSMDLIYRELTVKSIVDL